VLACTAYKKSPVPSEAEDEKTIDARLDQLVAAAAARKSVATMAMGTP
jgi:hypothetical protein